MFSREPVAVPWVRLMLDGVLRACGGVGACIKLNTKVGLVIGMHRDFLGLVGSATIHECQ